MFFNKSSPYIIAGPCSAESREQVMDTASALKEHIDLFRAGVWKPRTRPGSFEGNGEQALTWLKEAKTIHNIQYTVEVAEPHHVELALTYGASALWVGARTTVNPFQVQTIADSLKGTNTPILIKNPVTPDIDLWQGAIERFEKAGISAVAAVHRGFTGHKVSAGGYRNPPNWPIPIELKRRRPDLKILNDPSHITGDRTKVAAIAQKAMDMHFDGLMIETHPHPENAWTDAAQQITPEAFILLIDSLIIRKEFTADMNSQAVLESLRQAMDSIDQEIVDLIARRMELSMAVGEVKKTSNMTIYQPSRWREIVAVTADRAQMHGISKEFIHSLYEKIHHESIQKQLHILTTAAKEIKS